MKNRCLAIARTLLPAIFLFPVVLNGQNLTATISGINASCDTFCSTYTLQGQNGKKPYTYMWGTGATTQSTKICFYFFGTQTIFATVTDATGSTAEASLTVVVKDGPPMLLEADDAAYCQEQLLFPNNWKVCPNTTVTYRLNQKAIDAGAVVTTMAATGALGFVANPQNYTMRVNWGEPGSGALTLTGYYKLFCSVGVWQPVVIVNAPRAVFRTDPAWAAPDTLLRICRGQTVWFDNKSEDADTYEWNFGDGAISRATNPEHVFDQPGTYSVALVAYSLCRCADTSRITVEVLDAAAPAPECVGTVCPGGTATYTSPVDCAPYQWTVSSNGTLLSGGGPGDASITVQWNSGPAGILSLQTANCAGAACPLAGVARIPVLSDNAEIRGPEVVCYGDLADYSIEAYGGTGFTWTASPGATILRNDGTNSISVQWFTATPEPPAYWVAVEYENCYLGCSGRDTIWVNIRTNFSVAGPVERCENATGSFSTQLGQTNQGVSCRWYLRGPLGDTVWVSAGASLSATVPFLAGPGTYELIAVPANPALTCQDKAVRSVRVPDPPARPLGISGISPACPGQQYAYKAVGLPPGAPVDWTLSAQDFSTTRSGNPVLLPLQTKGPWLLAARQRSADALGCLSDSVLLQIDTIGPFPVNGPTELCAETVASYSAPVLESMEYTWTIVPAGAGTILAGQGSPNVVVFWQQAGTHTLQAAICGHTADLLVSIRPNPEPEPVYPPGLCPGDTALVQTAKAFVAYAWRDGQGALLGTAPTIQLEPGNFALRVVDKNGCAGTREFAIGQYPEPNLSLTTVDPTGFCANAYTVTLRATASFSGGYQYQWFRDSVPLAAAGPVYSTNQYGKYTVRATNAVGCTAEAGPVEIFEYCQGIIYAPGEPVACPPGSVDIEVDATPRCDSFQFRLLTGPNYVPGSGFWLFGVSGSNLLATSQQANPSFVFPDAGQYIAMVYAVLTNGAICRVVDSLRVEAAANFAPYSGCPGDTTFFRDNSTVVPGSTITNWAWTFGDGPGAVNTSGDAEHVYAASGKFPVTLTLTAGSGCTASRAGYVAIAAPPVPVWTAPPATCAGNALPFSANIDSTIAHVAWDFGEPAAGAANAAYSANAFHRYGVAGNFAVQLTLTNNFGCSATQGGGVDIRPNSLSGKINPATPPLLCEGTTIDLHAPPGGIHFNWSTGDTTATIVASEEDRYSVTLTDSDGCTYTPPSVNVTVRPDPDAVIKALLLDDQNQIAGVQYGTLHVCVGDPVQLLVEGSGSTYNWSGGQQGQLVIYSEERNNLLPVGVHTFTVTVTDAFGCTGVTQPFRVYVDPVPAGFSIAASNRCATAPAVLQYTGPQLPGWTIRWNTGAADLPLIASAPGRYFVRVTNEFGCAAQSNTVDILPGPPVAAVPAGCYTRCRPDTICLPVLPGITTWQWYLDGNPLAGASGNSLVASESGTYWVQMTDTAGCIARSAPLQLHLQDGVGNIQARVWSDVNNSGAIDAGDTLVSGIGIVLTQNGIPVGAAQSAAGAPSTFPNFPAADYQVAIDPAALHPAWQIVIGQQAALLTGCDGFVEAGLLLKFNCLNIPPVTVQFSACPGSSVLYNGMSIAAGTNQTFSMGTANGCDSVVTVNVSTLPTSAGSLNVQVCPGTNYTYNNTSIPAGNSQQFVSQNSAGCDSVLTVNVGTLPTSAGSLNVKVCPGTSYTYNGTSIPAGSSQQFVLQNAVGCDSVVTVNVGTLPTSTGTLNVQVCPGTSYTYNGTSIPAGSSQQFVLTNALGCDSVLTVNVGMLATSTGSLNVQVCPGTSYTYNNTSIPAGSSQQFVLTNALGCDSVLTVNVGALATSTGSLNVQVCPGTSYTYNNTAIPAGSSQQFVLQNAAGCDSVLTVNVGTLATSAGSLNVQVCPGMSYTYNGTSIPAGSSQQFVLQNAAGCDSVLTVYVGTLATSTGSLNVKVCPGTSYTYNNASIPAGSSQQFVLQNSAGCDSVLTVNVGTLATSTGALNARVCPGESFIYNGNALQIGQSQVFTLQNAAGCDSLLSVTVSALPTSSEPLAVTICPNDTYTYAGETLKPGQTRVFHFTNSEGCDSSVVVMVAALPAATFSLEALPSCAGTGTGSLRVLNPGGGLPPYRYSLDGTAFQDELVFKDLPQGDYKVWLEDSNACLFRQDVSVPALLPLSLHLDDAVLPCDTGGVQLNPFVGGDTTGLQYRWSTGAQTPVLTVYDPGPLWVEIRNVCETLHRDVQVNWADVDPGISLGYVPNVFAPASNDPDNARFRPYFRPDLTIAHYRFEIFDRWGNLMFRSFDPTEGWTGPFRAQDMQPGVYVWYLLADVAYCGRVRHLEWKRDVTIVR